MNDLTLNLTDDDGTRHQRVHPATAERFLAALSADPRNVGELEDAVRRYVHGDAAPHFVADLRPGVSQRPGRAGLVWIDLGARLIAYEATSIDITRAGWVAWHNGIESTAIRIPFRLADDWLLIDDIATCQAHAAARRQRQARVRDTRRVLYGALAEYLVDAVAATREPTPQAIRRIHAAWLMEQRSDLHEQSPRDVLLRHREHIDCDIENQAQRWARIGSNPPPLRRDSSAYRQGGYGTHEIVLYYELVRSMLHACCERVRSTRGTIDLAAEIEWLAAFQQEWLHTPQHQELNGRSPTQVIGYERSRLPFALTGLEAMADCTCPICQAMAADDTPVFMHLDSLFMDPDFAFSFHTTRQAWEEEIAQWRRLEATVGYDFDNSTQEPLEPTDVPATAAVTTPPAWFRARPTSYESNWPAGDRCGPVSADVRGERLTDSTRKVPFADAATEGDPPPVVAVEIHLLGIGAQITALNAELDRESTDDSLILAAGLRRRYQTLCDATLQPTWVVDKAVSELRSHLAEIEVLFPSLRRNCQGLEQQFQTLIASCRQRDEAAPYQTPF